MRAGFFAPMPPLRSGVADYAAALFEAMRATGKLSLNEPGDVNLYHLGNNWLHYKYYERALSDPGVAVLHDAVLQHFFLGFGEQQYLDEFTFNYGDDSLQKAHELWQGRARSASDPRYFAYPMLKRIATRSKSIIVHNPAAAAAVLRHASDARVIEIPHLFAPPTISRGEVRGIAPRTFLVSVFGYMRESKRLPSILRAMHRVWMQKIDATLLIAGDFASPDLQRALTPLLCDSRVVHTHYLAEPHFWRIADRTDLCINLRYPSAHETSGIGVRLMGIGKPVVFTDGDEIARIPENACLRVDAGQAEEEMLASTIVWAAKNRDALAQIGANAARNIALHHTIESCAEKYWEALRTA